MPAPAAAPEPGFADQEMKIILAVLLQRFRPELIEGSKIDRIVSIGLTAKHGFPMTIHRADGNYSGPPPSFRGNVHSMLSLPD